MNTCKTVVTPSIYVACLASYNAGILYGEWISCDQDADDILADIQAMLAESNQPYAEDWRIDDYEGFEDLKVDDYHNLEKLSEVAQLIAKHGKAYSIYANNFCGDQYPSESDFESAYLGCYEDEEEFCYERWENDGKIDSLRELGIDPDYIDWEYVARDLDGYFIEKTGYKEIYVFIN